MDLAIGAAEKGPGYRRTTHEGHRAWFGHPHPVRYPSCANMCLKTAAHSIPRQVSVRTNILRVEERIWNRVVNYHSHASESAICGGAVVLLCDKTPLRLLTPTPNQASRLALVSLTRASEYFIRPPHLSLMASHSGTIARRARARLARRWSTVSG